MFLAVTHWHYLRVTELQTNIPFFYNIFLICATVWHLKTETFFAVLAIYSHLQPLHINKISLYEVTMLVGRWDVTQLATSFNKIYDCSLHVLITIEKYCRNYLYTEYFGNNAILFCAVIFLVLL